MLNTLFLMITFYRGNETHVNIGATLDLNFIE